MLRVRNCTLGIGSTPVTNPGGLSGSWVGTHRSRGYSCPLWYFFGGGAGVWSQQPPILVPPPQASFCIGDSLRAVQVACLRVECVEMFLRGFIAVALGKTAVTYCAHIQNVRAAQKTL